MTEVVGFEDIAVVEGCQVGDVDLSCLPIRNNYDMKQLPAHLYFSIILLTRRI